MTVPAWSSVGSDHCRSEEGCGVGAMGLCSTKNCNILYILAFGGLERLNLYGGEHKYTIKKLNRIGPL